MDIPDFQLVIQWRAENLSMCSLMQRLGRAARNPSIQGTFLLFAESKYFDRNNKPKPGEETPATQEQHPCNPSDLQDPNSEQHPCNPSDLQVPNSEISRDSMSITPESITDLKSNRKSIYADHYRAQVSSSKLNSGKVKSPADPDPGVGDTINASERGLECRNDPANITFENDSLSKYIDALIILLLGR